jgi:hypothetical protein
MEQNPLDRKQPAVSSLNEVLPIQKTRGLVITKREQIKEIVEGPLVSACEVFWDKNIKTYESSANSQDIQKGHCYIRIDFDSLSEENKKIAQQYSEPYNDVGVQVLELVIPVTGSETVNEVSDKAVELANTFHKQKATWIEGTTLQQHIDWLSERYGKYPQTAEEIERLKQSGVWEEECKRLGKYFDPETQTSWASEEYYKKFKESDTIK